MKFLIIHFTAIILLFTNLSPCLSITEVNKDLSLVTGYSYLLIFNERILNYSPENKDSIKVESLPNIFNEEQEILIEPIKDSNTSLIVKTALNIYKFNISIDDVDKPPSLSDLQNKVSDDSKNDFDLDIPPESQE